MKRLGLLVYESEAFIFNDITNSIWMNKKIVLLIVAIVVIVGISATLMVLNPSGTILPIPPPKYLHNGNSNSSNRYTS